MPGNHNMEAKPLSRRAKAACRGEDDTEGKGSEESGGGGPVREPLAEETNSHSSCITSRCDVADFRSTV